MTERACPFCTPDAERVFYQGARVRSLGHFPVSDGHALIVTKRHVATWFDASRGSACLALARRKRHLELTNANIVLEASAFALVDGQAHHRLPHVELSSALTNHSCEPTQNRLLPLPGTPTDLDMGAGSPAATA